MQYNMLKNILFLIMTLIAGVTYGQDILNLDLLSNVQFGEDGNDIWGFVDENGTEYAVMGTRTATRIYSLEDPTNPIERYTVFGLWIFDYTNSVIRFLHLLNNAFSSIRTVIINNKNMWCGGHDTLIVNSLPRSQTHFCRRLYQTSCLATLRYNSTDAFAFIRNSYPHKRTE